ncbi:MAG: hypothetical protein JXB15_08110 [Anaerolineales bacterium]|nr:hypothetical protein [Anaerolineales bacterium]
MNLVSYYTPQGPISDPKQYAPLCDNLPTSLAGLVRLAQGITIHAYWS